MNWVGGGWFGVLVVPIGGAIGLILLRRPWAAAYFLAAEAVSAGGVQVLKHLFGRVRPEDIIESRTDLQPGRVPFQVTLDVVEPMGMETMVYFIVSGVEVCGRVNPAAAKNAGETMPLVADLNHMHLIDPKTDLVL